MIWVSFIWFALLYGVGFFLSPNKDIFGPQRLASLKLAIFNLPFILYTAIYPKSFLKGILTICNTNLYDAFVKYTLAQTLAYLSLIAGIWLFGKKCDLQATSVIVPLRPLMLYTFGLCILALGGYAFFLHRVGGLAYLVSHLHQRVALQARTYVLLLLELMPLVVLMGLLLYRQQQKVKYAVFTILSLILFSLIYTSLGGRKPTMILISIAIIGYHYYLRKISFTRKTVIAAMAGVVLFSFYLLTVPYLRMPAQKQHAVATTEQKVFTPGKFVYNLCYTYIDIMVVNYYNVDNAWYMRGYLDSAKSFAYKGDKGNLPQVDQGVYLKSIYLYQKDFRPPMPRKEVSPTSWPTENFGFAFANFAWYGIIPCFFLLGLVYGYVYKAALKYMYNPVILLFYAHIMIQFNFSSLRIAFFLKTLPLLYLCFVVFNNFVLPKNQEEDND